MGCCLQVQTIQLDNPFLHLSVEQARQTLAGCDFDSHYTKAIGVLSNGTERALVTPALVS